MLACSCSIFEYRKLSNVNVILNLHPSHIHLIDWVKYLSIPSKSRFSFYLVTEACFSLSLYNLKYVSDYDYEWFIYNHYLYYCKAYCMFVESCTSFTLRDRYLYVKVTFRISLTCLSTYRTLNDNVLVHIRTR